MAFTQAFVFRAIFMLLIYAITVTGLLSNYKASKNLCANERQRWWIASSNEICALQFFNDGFVSALICNLTSTDWRKRVRGDNAACGPIQRRRTGDLNGTIPLCCRRNWRDLSRNRLQPITVFSTSRLLIRLIEVHLRNGTLLPPAWRTI